MRRVSVGESCMEIKTEADSDDATDTECPHDDKPAVGMLSFFCDI